MRPLLAALALALAGTACHRERPPERPALEPELRLGAPELQDEQGDPAELRAVVYRSASYRQPPAGQATWLALYLPGFDGAPEALGEALAGVEAPLVLVAVDGRTRLGGAWYADSAASGRWQAALLETLLPAARALAPGVGPEQTLLVGHSMGGHAALRLALEQPGLFRGAGLLNPALRPRELAALALAKVERARSGQPPDLEALLRAPDPARFWERLLFATQSAFAPQAGAPGGLALPFESAERPWRLRPALDARLAELDLTRTPPEALARLDRLYASTGESDPVSPPADLRALDVACLAPASARVTVHPGGHAERLASDLGEALRFLTAPGPARPGRCPR